jgi:hypothetical protein
MLIRSSAALNPQFLPIAGPSQVTLSVSSSALTKFDYHRLPPSTPADRVERLSGIAIAWVRKRERNLSVYIQ